MSRRRERFASALKTVVANLIQTDLNDPRIRGLITVTRVNISPDLRLAKVYVSVLGDEGVVKSTLSGLQHSAGHLQSLLKKHLEFRTCPILDFRLDEELKTSLATMALLDKVSAELAAKDSGAGATAEDGRTSDAERPFQNEEEVE